MFETYYQTELSYLRDMGRAFAEKHPALAGMLSERGTDPDVERLLEGFAFVAARLRQRIDDAAPELVETLAELLLPQTLRPTPSCTLVEFRPAPRALRGRVLIPRGARLVSPSARGGRCTFTTTADVQVTPLRLSASVLDDSAASRPELICRFEAEPGTLPTLFTREGLRLHLHGEPSLTSQLYLWIARHLVGVRLRGESGTVVELGPAALRPSPFSSDAPLVPWPAFAPHSTRLLLEYFTLPAKFLFFDLSQLERAAHLDEERFELILRFSKPPPLPSQLPQDVVRLHCAPAVNLFASGAEPVRAGVDESPTLLRAAGLDPSHAEVFAVTSVTGMARGAARVQYEPFHAFRATQPHTGFYKLHRRISPVDEGIHTLVTLHRAPEAALSRGDETLSIELVCTNRNLAQQLQVGDLCEPTPDIPAGVVFSNIGRVTPPARAPVGTELVWHFMSHVATTRRSLSDLEVLKTLLSLYGAHERVDFAASRVNRARIEALQRVGVETITRVVSGVAARGSLYRVEAEQTGFQSEGDAYLFGCVLQALLSIDARINTFADLRLKLLPSAMEWRFDAELPP